MIQAASAFSGDDLQRLKAERLRAEQAQAAAGEDLQWATAAMLTREELAEKLSAITAKASATPVTASIFYLDVEPSELLGYRGAAEPGSSTCEPNPNATLIYRPNPSASPDPIAQALTL